MAYAKRQAIAEGKEEGRAEGLAEGRADTIRQLLKSGMAIEVISEALNLSEEEIRKITETSPE